jgi:predicted NBD/HSP70 family sugar kinase
MHPKPREARLRLKMNRILAHLFREGEASRFALARRLNLNASMVGKYVDDLLRRGLLLEDARAGTRRGRVPVALRLNPAHGRFLGLDFEALRARAVLTDFAGGILARREVPFRAGLGREKRVEALLSLAGALARQAGRRLLALGVAAPGLVDVAAGRVLRYPLVPDFEDVPLRELFEARFDVPILVEHNIHTLTLAETLRGGGKGLTDVLCLVVRSGLGLGVVMDGRIQRGKNARAGLVGFTRFAGAERMTDLVSATGLLKRAGARTLAEVVANPRHARLLEGAGRTLGLLMANLAHLFAPEKIILVGEVPACSPRLRAAMEREFRRHLLPELPVSVADSRLEGYGAALGAADLGFLRRFPAEPF